LQLVANVTSYIYPISKPVFSDHLENKDGIPISSLTQAQNGKDEFEKFEFEILGLLTNEVDRDYVESSSEIDFLEGHVGTESYSSSQLQIAKEKVDDYKKRARAIKIELEERSRN
jgi:hypothetical protein